ncbi:hypothetical protein [Spirilliplanes yamanashiensis]|uniref:Uncharacterized protein n=1 Tax=Spirilliplanes yamanashiensis TaxID=42233 RepID=A0A8J3YE36_9ACTN|nr:hypothetical protein [Spirilliplanes yamanashiensis]MDP9816722.1 hypothetical protein [Spirilliplanes yamanashiensis]GIJ06245.1 hypothetical protein Sya03_55970 [Spirilliplanes yamanashiensis]
MTDDDLRARLRRADPAGTLPPLGPGPTQRLLENAMTIAPERPAARRRPWLAGAAAAAVVAVIAGVGLARSDDPGPGTVAAPPPTVTRVVDRSGGTEKCLPPRAERLAEAGLAFEGTVRSVDGDVVTLVPARFLTGPATDLVEVEQADESSEALVGATRFEVGETYLVAVVDGTVLICGYSGLATPELRQLYDEAF